MNVDLLTAYHYYEDEDEKLIDIDESKRKKINKIYINGFNNKLNDKYKSDYYDEFIITSHYISYIKKDSEKETVFIKYKIEIDLDEFYSIEKVILENDYYHKTQSGLLFRDYVGRYSSYLIDVDYFDSKCYLNKPDYFDYFLGHHIKELFIKRGISLPIPEYLDYEKSRMKNEYEMSYEEIYNLIKCRLRKPRKDINK